MSSLFADTHNVVVILEKSDAAEGFEQILDFISGSYIHYALTVNPHIYISCIKQFWNTASVKRSDDVTRLQPLVDKKKIMISEVVIREIMQLDDAEGVVCLPNEEIFTGLAQMGYEKPSTKQSFYKAFFSNSSSKFYMYPRFIQLIIQNQVGDLSTHSTRFISPVLTPKVFANMRWVGKGFSGVETPLFKGMLATRQLAEEGLAEEQVQADDAAVLENVAEDVTNDAIPSPPSHDIPSPSQAQPSPPRQPQRRVKNLENDKADQKLETIKLKARVKRLEMANKVKSSKLRRLRKVEASRRIESSDDMEDVFNQGKMIDDLDKDEGIELVKDADIAETEGRHAAEQAKKQAEIYHLDLDHPSKVFIPLNAASATISAAKPSILAAAPIVVAAYTRRRKGVIIRDPEEELSSKTHAETPGLKDKGKAKRRKLNKEAQEAEELKKQLEIVNDEDDDVFTEATPLGRKTMFKKPDGQDAVWRNQNSVYGQALVKSWKLLTSCGVHIISLTTTNFILLVERRYPLSKFTLEQLVNATRLQVEEESEMSLELLRFTRQQLYEYQQG
nr:hypothetical protein [Tanacetum cinerariifolium]